MAQKIETMKSMREIKREQMKSVVIEDFKEWLKSPDTKDLHDCNKAYGQCYEWSEGIANRYRNLGYKSEMIHLQGPRFKLKDSPWHNTPNAGNIIHFVVRVCILQEVDKDKCIIVDPTAIQFGKNYASEHTITSLPELRKKWSYVMDKKTRQQILME